MKFVLTFIIICFFLNFSFGQENPFLKDETRLSSELRELRLAKSDSLTDTLNLKFKKDFRKTIGRYEAFFHPFDSLNTIGKIISDDGLVRVITWNVEQKDLTQHYFGFILRRDEKKKTIQVTELVDFQNASPRTEEVIDASHWYGALYYKIIDVTKNNKKHYTLLGYDAAFASSNIKLIDVLTFTGKSAKFGAPIFKLKDKTVKRVIFEYSYKAVMSLKYDNERSIIIADHLSPETANLAGFYEYYVPDFSYDSYKWVKDKWVMEEDILALNSGDVIVKVATPTNDPNNPKIKEIDAKWENPSKGGPEGEDAHKAEIPEESKDANGKPRKKSSTSKDKPKAYSEKDFQQGPYGLKKKKKRR